MSELTEAAVEAAARTDEVAALSAAKRKYPDDFASEGDRFGSRVAFVAGWQARAALTAAAQTEPATDGWCVDERCPNRAVQHGHVGPYAMPWPAQGGVETDERHPAVPGVDQDDPTHPDPRWCNVCGESADAPQHAETDEREALRAEVATLREALHLGTELDNHHNAAMCPYCRRSQPAPRTALDREAFVQEIVRTSVFSRVSVEAMLSVVDQTVPAPRTVTALQIAGAASAAERQVYPEHTARAENTSQPIISRDDLRWLTIALYQLGIGVTL